ncbi:DUF721 domain-containing protein [Burkholderiaceae bacterium DAT-1]|nr:DUF721 domain-containing protein [Burkholderiaceae bacterium DAT-1]
MNAHSLEQIFRQPEMRKLAQIMHAATTLDAKWQRVLPQEFVGSTQAVGIDQGELVVMTRQSALAAKLRQMSFRLVQSLRTEGLDVSGIRVRLQVEVLPHQGKKASKNLQLSETALSAFEDAVEQIQDQTVRGAMEQLLARRRSGRT